MKSRFAVCNGASFLQRWGRNNQPVGENMFNVRVVGTIVKNSRTIDFRYYFTGFVTTGTTGAAAMPITTKGNIPQSMLADRGALHPHSTPVPPRTPTCG